jgi:hypothetical protein
MFQNSISHTHTLHFYVYSTPRTRRILLYLISMCSVFTRKLIVVNPVNKLSGRIVTITVESPLPEPILKQLIHHHHHHHHAAIKELGHLLTRSGSHIQKSLPWSSLAPSASCGAVCICHVTLDLGVRAVSSFSCGPVFCLKLGLGYI